MQGYIKNAGRRWQGGIGTDSHECVTGDDREREAIGGEWKLGDLL